MVYIYNPVYENVTQKPRQAGPSRESQNETVWAEPKAGTKTRGRQAPGTHPSRPWGAL